MYASPKSQNPKISVSAMASSTSPSVTDANMVGKKRSRKRKSRSSHSPHSETGPGHGVGGGRHIPSHSSGSVISNVPVTVGATSVVQPSSSVTAQTILPEPAQVSPAPLLPTGMALCEICEVQCDTPHMLELHKNSKKHLKKMKVETSKPMAFCEICKVQCDTPHMLEQHKNSKKHLKKMMVDTSKPMELLKPEQTVSFTCELCDVEINSVVDYQNHITGMEHLVRLRSVGECQSSSGVGLQVDNDTTMKKEGADGGSKYMRTNDGSESVEKPAETPFPLICGLCNIEFSSEAWYQEHINGKMHITREGNYISSLAKYEGIQNAEYRGLWGFKEHNPPDINALSNAIDARVQQGGANDPDVLFGQLLMMVLSEKDKWQKKLQAKQVRLGKHRKRHKSSKNGVSKTKRVPLGSTIQPGQQQVLSGAYVGLQALYPPDSNALSNATNAQVQQGDNDPLVLLDQRLMNVICQAQAPPPPAGTGTTAAHILPPTSMARPSYQPQLPPADASIRNYSTCSSIITQIEGGDSETKQV